MRAQQAKKKNRSPSSHTERDGEKKTHTTRDHTHARAEPQRGSRTLEKKRRERRKEDLAVPSPAWQCAEAAPVRGCESQSTIEPNAATPNRCHS